MAEMRSLFELSPSEVRRKPALRRFFPMKVALIRFKWFNWFWYGKSQHSNHSLLIGPFWTKRGARRAWDKVPTTEPDMFGRGGPFREDPSNNRQFSGSFTDNLKGQ